MNELVELDEQMSVVGDVNGLAIVIVFGSKVHANSDIGRCILVLNNDFVVVGFVVELADTSDDIELILVMIQTTNTSQLNVLLFEVSYELIESDLLNFHTGVDKVVILVSWQRFLVALEQFQDSLPQLVECGIAGSGLGEFQSRWGVAPDVVVGRCITDELTSCSLKGSVVSGVNASAGTFDEFTEDVQTLGLVDREELVLGCQYVARVDGVQDSLLKGVDVLDQILMDIGEVNLVVATGEF